MDGEDGFANVLDRCLAVREGEQVVLLTDAGTDDAVVAGLVAGIERSSRRARGLDGSRSPRCPAPSRRAPSPR